MTVRPEPLEILAACVLLVALTAFGLGCDSDKQAASCPSCPIGTISGYVIGGEGALSAEVTTISTYHADPTVNLSVQTDSTGWYTLSLPLGKYLLRARTNMTGHTVLYYKTCGSTWSKSEADTLALDGAQLRADFACGGVAVSIHIPGASDGKRFKVGLTEIGVSSPKRRCSQLVEATDEVLAFGWDAVVSGAYAIYLWPSRSSRIWLPTSFELESAETLLVQAGETTSYATSFSLPAQIVGEVLGSWQLMGLRDPPTVSAFNDDSLFIARAIVDDEGHFALNFYIPMPVRLQVSIEGMGCWIGADNFLEATTFEPEAGGTLVIDPYIESGIVCSFSGPGSDTDHRAMISLVDAGGSLIMASHYNPYRVNPIPIPNLAPGTYYLHVERVTDTQRWLPQWYDQADSLQDATPIEVFAGGEATEVTVRLIEGGAIHGRILMSDRSPYGNWCVRVCPASDSTDAYARVMAGEMTGAFSAVGLPDAAYKLGLWYGGPYWWYPGTWDWEAAEVISIEDHSKVTGVEWCLPE